MIADIELTLVSIIQGVALAVLITNASTVVTRLQFAAWPYVLSALFVILVFWSRAVLHIITVIRWPIEFGHNFLYIGCALVEAISFSQISHPARWFGFGAAFIAVGWLLFAYDLRLVNARISDSAGAASDRMCELVKRDQYLNLLVLLPALFCFNVASAWSIHTLPQLFLGRHAHLWLIALQVIGVLGYLLYLQRFFGKLAPLIADARAEWRGHDKDL
jgi:hypothetical protein